MRSAAHPSGGLSAIADCDWSTETRCRGELLVSVQDEAIDLTTERQTKPDVVDKELANLLGQKAMDDLEGVRDVVAFVVPRHHAHMPILNEDLAGRRKLAR